MNKNFVIIGDYESTVMFKIFGWDCVYVNLKNKEEILSKFKDVLTKNYKIIFLIEEVYEILYKKFSDFEKIKIPLIPIPGIRGAKNLAKKKYQKLTTIATGVKIVSS